MLNRVESSFLLINSFLIVCSAIDLALLSLAPEVLKSNPIPLVDHIILGLLREVFASLDMEAKVVSCFIPGTITYLES
jgi:hypothetical protein